MEANELRVSLGEVSEAEVDRKDFVPVLFFPRRILGVDDGAGM